MRVPGLRSISGRIILGFAILTITFAGITVQTVVNMSALGNDLRVIRLGYVKLAFTAHDLDNRQRQLVSVLDEIPSETDGERVARRLQGLRKQRESLIERAVAHAEELDRLPRRHPLAIREIQRNLDQLRDHHAELGDAYEALMAAPPVRRRGQDSRPAAEVQAAQAGQVALDTIRRREVLMRNQLSAFSNWLDDTVAQTAERLEENEHKVRRWTIYLGATAVLLGLLVTAWATLTLRPLRSLRDAARNVARGDYASRIDETGPAEVADLAREFNVMGRAVQERERELVRSERLAAIGKMAAMITHEVRNPLSSIGLNTELLEEELGALSGPAGDEARALCRAITTEVDRLTDITEEYLSFARLPQPKLARERINGVVENLAEFEREPLAMRRVELTVELDPEVPVVRIDEGQLRQALLNLVRNAADAVAEIGGGRVTLATRRRAAGGVAIVVEDDGPGMTPDVIGKIFDPFFSTKEGGTGLGLALTHEIIREHGGSIEVDSEPGRGARFTVELPGA